MSGVLIAAVALPLIAALVIVLLRLTARIAARAAIGAGAAAFMAAFVILIVTAVDGPTSAVVTDEEGRAVLGLDADRVGGVLIVLTTLVGLIVQSFASRSLLGDPRARRFHVLALVLTAAATSVAVAATGSGLLVAWIATSVTMVALIGHRAPWAPALAAQRRTGWSFVIGDLALLAAVIAAVATVGDIDLRTVGTDAAALNVEQVAGVNAVTIVAVLLVIAGVARSALIPIHRWLPSTLAAPTPVSALLHAGVVNGAGVLLIRFSPIFGSSATAMTIAFVLGLLTALIATALMLVRTDVKGGLVWSTSGQMGFMVVQLAVGAFAAALFHIVGHALYKATMFLGAGGAISAHQRQVRRPHLGQGDASALRSTPIRLVVGVVVPLCAFAFALLVVDPHLTAAATILIVVFGTLSIGRAANGWMTSAPFSAATSIATALVGVVAGVFAYVVALTMFENFVADVVPYDVPAAVGPVGVAVSLTAIALTVGVVAFTRGPTGDDLRRRVYAWLQSTGASEPIAPAPHSDARSLIPSTSGCSGDVRRDRCRHRWRTLMTVPTLRSTDIDRSLLVADVARAGAFVAPYWPLTSFVAVNPLGGLQDHSFAEATGLARRWLQARTHLPITAYREEYRRGTIGQADLDRSIRRRLPWATDALPIVVGHLRIGVIDVIRWDLLHGPAGDASPAPAATRADALDDVLTTWCATFVDDAHVPWAMPDRSLGFYRSWRALAAGDRRLAALVGRDARERIETLPNDAVQMLDLALRARDIDEADRVTAVRTLLLRAPGWAGFARWCDDWAPADRAGVRLRMLDLAAVRAALDHVAPEHLDLFSASPSDGSFDARIDAAASAVVHDTPTGADRTAIASVICRVSDAERAAIWLDAHEWNFRDRLLTRLDVTTGVEPDPGRMDAQLVFCIDVRSEGLRRHLEGLGRYETFGFAGFFGVPVRWRPLGSGAGQARCPVLVSPRHEIAEIAVEDDWPYLSACAATAGLHDAFHAAKGGIASPFALAESVGWFAGPVAAVRTFTPGRAVTRSRRPPWWRRFTSPPRTAPVIDEIAGQALQVGLALEERTLFAEAIVTTIGMSDFAPVVVLCGHGSRTTNNPHASSLDCGACGGAPGGASARIAVAILNDPAVRAALTERGIEIPDDTWFVAAEHDTTADVVTIFDHEIVPVGARPLVEALQRDLDVAGERNARDRARRLPGRPDRVRDRGRDWAQVRPEWGLAGNAAFVIGPRTITADHDLESRAFLHSYVAERDPDGVALETIMTAPLVVAQWISAQYYFSTVDPGVFGAGDKMLHNPVGGVGVVVGQSGDLAVGLPLQSVMFGEQRAHDPLRLLAVVQAPLDRIDRIVLRNTGLHQLVEGEWIHVVARENEHDAWWSRTPSGGWEPWHPADPDAAGSAHLLTPLEIS